MRINREHIVGIVCLSVSAVTWVLAAGLPKGQSVIAVSGPALFPTALAAVLAICGVSELVLGTLKRDELPTVDVRSIVRKTSTGAPLSVALIVLLLVGFIVLFPILGFFLTCFLFLFLCMKLFGVSWKRNVLASVSFLVVLYLVFGVLFTISLPSGVLRYVGL